MHARLTQQGIVVQHARVTDFTYHHSPAFALLYLQLVTVLVAPELPIGRHWHVDTGDAVGMYDMCTSVWIETFTSC